MIGCITQNIDGLHVDGGLPESAVAEVHGNPRGIMCVEQGHRSEVDEIRQRWQAGDGRRGDSLRCCACCRRFGHHSRCWRSSTLQAWFYRHFPHARRRRDSANRHCC